MSKEHTPGPWGNLNGIIAQKGTLKAIAVVDYQPEVERDANRNLIVAAPELLSACEAIAHGMKETQGFAPNFLETAIAKARGLS